MYEWVLFREGHHKAMSSRVFPISYQNTHIPKTLLPRPWYIANFYMGLKLLPPRSLPPRGYIIRYLVPPGSSMGAAGSSMDDEECLETISI